MTTVMPIPGPRALGASESIAAALLRPSGDTYRRLAAQPGASPGRAVARVFACSLLGAAIASAPPAWEGLARRHTVDPLLVTSILLSAVLAVACFAAFGVGVGWLAALLGGRVGYGRLVHTFATFNAPLMVVAGALSLHPWLPAGFVVYSYWLILYGISLRAITGLSRTRTTAVLFLSVAVAAAVWVAAATRLAG